MLENLILVDTKILYFLNGIVGKSAFLDGVIIFFASYLPYVLIVVFLLLLYRSRRSIKKNITVFFLIVVPAVIARFGAVELIRFFYHRPRPFLILQLHPLLLSSNWSFPSGHAAFFFAFAMAIYLYNKKWGILFLIAASVVALCRVVAGVHYPSDILGGAIIGVVLSYGIVYLAKRNKNISKIISSPDI